MEVVADEGRDREFDFVVDLYPIFLPAVIKFRNCSGYSAV
jgi:hypothetical protein